MINITNAQKEKLYFESIYRELIIHFPDDADYPDIGSGNLIADSMELKQSICDGDFTFGGCITGQFKIKVIDVEQPLNGKKIKVHLRQTYHDNIYPSDKLYPSNDLFANIKVIEIPLFTGRIDSSLRQTNRAIKEIIAYDVLYEASRINSINLFCSIAAYSSNTKLSHIRNVFTTAMYEAFDEEYEDESAFSGVNDDVQLSLVNPRNIRDMFNDKLLLTDVLSAYCELNACFAYIDGDGDIKFKTFQNADLETINNYKSVTFEEFTTANINLIKFKYCNLSSGDNDRKYKIWGYGSDTQSWYASDNIITSCCSDIDGLLNENYRNMIFRDSCKYRPYSAEIFDRWWVEPGDKIEILTGYNSENDIATVESYVFERTIKGINGMQINIKADGTETLGQREIEAQGGN